MLLSSLPAYAEVGPMDTSCAQAVTSRNQQSIAHWSAYLNLVATGKNQWLVNPETGVEAKVDQNQYNAIRNGQPGWMVVRFYQTDKVLRNVAAGKPNAAIGGFSNNFMYVKKNGQCFVSKNRFDDMREFSQPFAYMMASYLTFMTLDLQPHPIPPELDSLYKAMNIEELKLSINAALLRLIQLENAAADNASATGSTQQQASSPDSEAEKDRLTKLYIDALKKFDEADDQ
jgi:hypothetical protein